MQFQDKVVLVTGSSRGIGRSIAVKFAQEGAKVIVNYKNSRQEAETITDILSTYGAHCISVQADVSDENQVKAMVDKIMEEYGRIDILVNNAGIALDGDFEEKRVEDWQATLNTNLVGVFLVSRYVGKFMKKAEKGKIVNVSSTNGIDSTYPYSVDYDASKAALINLTRNLAIQYAPNINVNTVAPGWVDTEMNSDLPKKYLQEEKEKILLKRFAEPEEIAELVLFLASDKARYIDGETIRIDGGFRF